MITAVLNDLDFMGTDIQNALLSELNLKQHWIISGPEFGAEHGKVFIAVRDLYGLKYASSIF